jgi:hypothetical protein
LPYPAGVVATRWQKPLLFQIQPAQQTGGENSSIPLIPSRLIAALDVPAASAAAIAKILNFIGIATSRRKETAAERRHRTTNGLNAITFRAHRSVGTGCPVRAE